MRHAVQGLKDLVHGCKLISGLDKSVVVAPHEHDVLAAAATATELLIMSS